jgi:hypothetical protein
LKGFLGNMGAGMWKMLKSRENRRPQWENDSARAS